MQSKKKKIQTGITALKRRTDNIANTVDGIFLFTKSFCKTISFHIRTSLPLLAALTLQISLVVIAGLHNKFFRLPCIQAAGQDRL